VLISEEVEHATPCSKHSSYERRDLGSGYIKAKQHNSQEAFRLFFANHRTMSGCTAWMLGTLKITLPNRLISRRGSLWGS